MPPSCAPAVAAMSVSAAAPTVIPHLINLHPCGADPAAAGLPDVEDVLRGDAMLTPLELAPEDLPGSEHPGRPAFQIADPLGVLRRGLGLAENSSLSGVRESGFAHMNGPL